MSQSYYHKLQTLAHIIDNAESFLLVAHRHPDPDTIGAVVAMARYLQSCNKKVLITCHDELPSDLVSCTAGVTVQLSSTVDITAFQVIIGCDNVDRGFDEILAQCSNSQVTVAIDHHSQVCATPDLLIARSVASSTCEILYDFFENRDIIITPSVAAVLLIGILGDTRVFHNVNTSARVLDIVASLVDVGVSLSQILSEYFAVQSLPILQLWGYVLTNAIVTPSGTIITAITEDDISAINMPTEDIKECAKEMVSLLCSVKTAPFAMMLLEMGDGVIKASLRAENDRGVDTTSISRMFGGGGHRLASGFEIMGRVVRTDTQWQVI